MPVTDFRPMYELDMIELADLFNRCFEGYLVPVKVNAEFASARVRRDGTDLGRSFVAMDGEERIALAQVAPRYRSIRLAAMGVAASARKQGVGRAVVAEFLKRARADGFEEAVLEVFEQNEAAVSLYRSFGFQVSQRLFGFTRDPSVPGARFEEVGLERYGQCLREEGSPLPWLHMPESAATMTLPMRCVTVDGHAFAVFQVSQGPGPILLHGFVVSPSDRGKGKGRELFEAVQAYAPGRSWILPQIFPEATAEFLEHLGFTRMDLNQFEMRLRLKG